MSLCVVAGCMLVAIAVATDDITSFDGQAADAVPTSNLNKSIGDFLVRESADRSINTTVNIMGNGKCSSRDQQLMDKRGPGNHDGSFPQILGSCGSGAWSLWWGFDAPWMARCVTRKTGISSGCADCFSASGTYGYRNCKGACLWSWCSKRCFDCAKPYEPTLLKCLGADPPDGKTC